MIKRLFLGWVLACCGLSAWALAPEVASRIAAGEGDDRVAALQQALGETLVQCDAAALP